MNYAVLVNTTHLTAYACAPIKGQKSAIERVVEYAHALSAKVYLTAPLPPQVSPGNGCKVLEGEFKTAIDLCNKLESAMEGVDALVYVAGDCPFLDVDLTRIMMGHCEEYRAEYSFADGFPVGLAPEIVAARALPRLRQLAENFEAPLTRHSLYSLIEKDINYFDIETEISPRDLRALRLSLCCDTKRNHLLVSRLASQARPGWLSILDCAATRLDIQRTLPAYFGIQVSGRCPQKCVLCPYPIVSPNLLERDDWMSLADYKNVLGQIEELSGDAVINLSLWGELSLHPHSLELIRSTLAYKDFSLIIETSGIGWDIGTTRELLAFAGDRIDWIVSLDAFSPELYTTMRGEGYTAAMEFVEMLLAHSSAHCHVQMVRTHDNDEELEAFWRGWKKKLDGVIVQKYSRYADFLPDKQVADLSPLVRLPCWHLKRDLSVLIDGSIPLCRECIQKEVILGNAFEPKGIESAWANAEQFHLAHCNAFPLSPAKNGEAAQKADTVDTPSSQRLLADHNVPHPCTRCDEHYTYNA